MSRGEKPKVGGANIESLLEGLKPIDTGVDSQVFRKGDWIIKRYLRQPLSKILQYQEETNTMAEYAGEYSSQVAGLGKVQLKVEPLLRVVQSEQTSFIYGISQYVGGVRPVNDKIPQLTDLLEKFTIEMKQTLGLRGIYVIDSNTKLQRGILRMGETLCNITDVCASINDLVEY